ncbi:MAG TPA: OsmC family protein [Thermoanaerobaculia bacterium]|nr:OsmC family protein [Thermoanaerobaculia bacterium]
MAEETAPEVHHFRASVTWEGDGAGAGEVRTGDGISIPIGSAVSLGGSGRGTNPEDLLLSAIGACFVGTWAIFLKKLGIAYAEPSVSVGGVLEKDPAGGYRMSSIEITCAVPQPLLERERPAVEKTLQLAEKYCIVSKVARASMPVRVTIAGI